MSRCARIGMAAVVMTMTMSTTIMQFEDQIWTVRCPRYVVLRQSTTALVYQALLWDGKQDDRRL